MGYIGACRRLTGHLTLSVLSINIGGMKTLGTRVNDSFADAIAFFAQRKEQTTAYFIREATREAARNSFRQTCLLYEQKKRLISSMREALRDGHWERLAGKDFPSTREEWVAQVDRYEFDATRLLREIREMKPYADVLEIGSDEDVATALTALVTMS